MSDRELHESFLREFTANEPAIRAFIRCLLPARGDADDVMQETAVVLWERYPEVRSVTEFRPWAFGVAKKKVLSWMRDKGRDRVVLSEAMVNLVADVVTTSEEAFDIQRELLRQCVERLEPNQRTMLMAAYQPKAKIQEVARGSGRSIGGFYQWLHRMRRLLLDCVQGELAKVRPPRPHMP